MLDVLWLIPAFPLAGFLIILLFGRRLGEPLAGWLATLMVAASFVVSVGVYLDMLGMSAEERSHVEVIFSWIPVGALQVDLALLADPLSIIMCLFVTGIGALIHMYSIGYMHGDPKFTKYFLYLNLFVFAMLLLVLGENMLVTFLGWEGVGTCSYFLIAFWHTRESAATAGKKAFVTNRIGDWGFMMAMFLAFSTVGSLSFGVLNNNAESGLLSPDHGDRHRRPAVRRCRRQVGPAAAVHLAPRRDGRPDARVGADPRGHDGHRRRVPDGARQPGAHGGQRLGRSDDRLGRRAHRVLRRHHRVGADRHQTRPRLLDRVAARVHVPRHRHRRRTWRPCST